MKDKLNIAMLGHKRIPSREGGIEIVVEKLSTRMVIMSVVQSLMVVNYRNMKA